MTTAKQRANKKWLDKNPEYPAQYIKQWRADNPDKVAAANQRARQSTPWLSLIRNARARARKKGLDCSIDSKWGRKTYTGFCELTGIKFDTTATGKGGKALSPSIDKINPANGYIPNNCRFILHCINNFKGQMSDEEMIKIIKVFYDRLH
jgi:hypothetical protein